MLFTLYQVTIPKVGNFLSMLHEYTFKTDKNCLVKQFSLDICYKFTNLSINLN